MKRKLCWNLKDILYLKQRETRKRIKQSNETILRIEKERREMYKMWSKADYVLYNEANKTFWKEYSKYSDIPEEINHFKEVKKKVEIFCLKKLIIHRYGREDPNKLCAKLRNSPEFLTIEESRWNSEFKVDHLFCLLLRMNDNVFRFTMKYVLKFDTVIVHLSIW